MRSEPKGDAEFAKDGRILRHIADEVKHDQGAYAMIAGSND